MTVVAVEREPGLALCADAAGERTSVEIALVEPVRTGETLLVHAGTAIARAAGAEIPQPASPWEGLG